MEQIFSPPSWKNDAPPPLRPKSSGGGWLLAGFLSLLLMTPVTMVLSSIVQGWVLTYLWAWFVVPLFHAPVLSLPAAIGLRLTVGTLATNLTSSRSNDKDKDEDKDKDKEAPEEDRSRRASRAFVGLFGMLLLMVLLPMLTLLFGWIVRSFL